MIGRTSLLMLKIVVKTVIQYIFFSFLW